MVLSMDPMFGLPCVQESRAMDSARTRNQSIEKVLAEKFESIDLDMKTRSGKLITEKNEIEDFLSRLDPSLSKQIQMPAGLSKREKAMYKKMAQCAVMTSMSLAEFDRQRKRKIERKPTMLISSNEISSTEPQGLQSLATHSTQNAKRGIRSHFLKTHDNKEDWAMPAASLVVSDDLKLCLPMNRQKHAVRDVWSRITSDDMRHKIAIKKTASSQSLTTQNKHMNSSVVIQSNSVATAEKKV